MLGLCTTGSGSAGPRSLARRLRRPGAGGCRARVARADVAADDARGRFGASISSKARKMSPLPRTQQDGGGDLDHQHGSLSSWSTLRRGTVRAGPEFRSIFASPASEFSLYFRHGMAGASRSLQAALIQGLNGKGSLGPGLWPAGASLNTWTRTSPRGWPVQAVLSLLGLRRPHLDPARVGAVAHLEQVDAPSGPRLRPSASRTCRRGGARRRTWCPRSPGRSS